ncbi:MAG: iron ABC transporter permease, partial [Candidatus Tectomicrobia bacterium]|nr:iron ABC transporter permease [Candidatus Tectomicrobia bacterium]
VIAFAVSLLIVMPLGYVLGNAFLVTGQVWLQLWQSRVPELLYNTLRLTAGVAAVTVVLGVGLAWLVVRYEFFGRSAWTWLLAAPLGIPPYIMAYGYTELFAYWGPLRPVIQRFLGPDVQLPALYNSLPAAVLVLSLATYPYVYLLSRAAFLRANLAFEEAGRLSGAGRLRTWLRVVLPMQRPAIAAGLFLVCLYVMADFGAVSILRYSTFTRAVYVQMAGRYDLMGAAALSLILVVLSFAFFLAERHFRRRSRFYQTTAGYRPGNRATLRGWRSVLAFCCCVVVFTIGFGVPVAYLGAEAWTSIGEGALDGAFWAYARNSVLGAAAAATVAVAAALPLAYVALRRPGRLHSLFLHASYAGYVLPGPIIALGLIFCTAHLMAPVYGTVAVVVLAYVVRFFPQCLQAGEAALHQITPALEEAGRSSGVPLWRVLYRVTLPLMRPALVTGWVLVFVNAMKELPATLLLRPVGFDTLAVRIWIETSEEFYAQAAPAA